MRARTPTERASPLTAYVYRPARFRYDAIGPLDALCCIDFHVLPYYQHTAEGWASL